MAGRQGREQDSLSSYQVATGYLPPAEEEEEEPDYEYQEAALPTYSSEGQQDAVEDLAAAVYQEEEVTPVQDEELEYDEELPTYNAGVYSPGSGQSYSAPLPESLPADSAAQEEDPLPAYNNGVYNGADDGTSYQVTQPGLPCSLTTASPKYLL